MGRIPVAFYRIGLGLLWNVVDLDRSQRSSSGRELGLCICSAFLLLLASIFPITHGASLLGG